MRKIFYLLLAAFFVFVAASAEAAVQPYQVVDIKKHRLASGGERINLIITTTERDLSKLSGTDFAETAECAYQYIRKTPAGSLAKQINVLLFDINHLDGSCLARAALAWNGRVLTAIKGKGPTKRQLKVCETIAALKGGYARTTTEEDYAQTAKLLKMKKSAVKKAYLDVGILSATQEDRSDLIDSVPGLLPVFSD